MVKVIVSVINYNNSEDTFECLKSLDKLNKNNLDVTAVVVDNASSDHFRIENNTIKSIDLTVIHNDKNLGFSGGHNIAIKYALEHNADYVLILNNDTTVNAEMLKFMLKSVDLYKESGVIVPKIYFFKGHEFHKNRYKTNELGKVIWYAGGYVDWENIIGKNRGVDEIDKGQYDESKETELATGCCMLIKKEVFEKIGFFQEKYFLYYEDTDFSIRTKNAGFKIIYQPEAVVWHKNAGSTGGSGSELQDYFISRNRLLFGMNYAPFRSKVAIIRESLNLLVNGRKWQKNGVRDFYFRRFGKGSYDV